MPLPRPEPSLKARALKLLGMRDYSRAELERKLAPHAPEAAALAQALDDLQAKGFVNDQRAAQSLVYRRAERYGTERIRQELRQKGLPPEAAAHLKASEAERARQVWRKRFGAAEPLAGMEAARERARQARFLAARGFSADTIRQVLSSRNGTEDDAATLFD